MFGGVNPAQMKAMMRQMGIKQEDIEAERVIIETANERIIIEPASVQKITMQGQTNYQISGDERKESRASEIKEEDIQLVMEKTSKSKEEAMNALKESKGDIAQAILSLS